MEKILIFFLTTVVSDGKPQWKLTIINYFRRRSPMEVFGRYVPVHDVERGGVQDAGRGAGAAGAAGRAGARPAGRRAAGGRAQ